MNLRHKILLLAIVPLILVVTLIAMLTTYQARSLSKEEIASFERSMLDAKKAELLNYLSLAQTSIRHIYDNADPDDEVAKMRVREILNAMTYGEDGYFFVYDYDGVNLVHPKQKHRVGKNWINLKDPAGNLVIKNLVDRAKEGGGFHRYLWDKPSLGQIADKISYAIPLEKWHWMLGTGIYIDDVARQMTDVKKGVEHRIKETTLIILLLSSIAIAIVFISGIAINVHEKRLADAKLKELTQRIIETQEEERGRVARELHDGISQILVSIKYTLEAALNRAKAGHQDAPELLEKGTNGLNTAIQEVRRISRDLRPSMLDDLGLSPALESLAGEFAKRTGIDVKIETVAFRNLLPDDAKTALYRVAQETLTNIERHAQASTVDLILTVPDGAVTLTIADNGKGFDANSKAKGTQSGIGLRNMQERLEYYDGELEITSSAAGTIIKASLPKGLLRSTAGGTET